MGGFTGVYKKFSSAEISWFFRFLHKPKEEVIRRLKNIPASALEADDFEVCCAAEYRNDIRCMKSMLLELRPIS